MEQLILPVENKERARLLAQALESIRDLKGDWIECGVYRGETLAALGEQLPADKYLWAADSFTGFPENNPENKSGFTDTSLAFVRERVSKLPQVDNIRFLVGYFEDTLPKNFTKYPRGFSLIHLDCDLGSSYTVALNTLYPHLVSGGWIVCDEYGYKDKYPEVKPVVDAFAAQHGLTINPVDKFRAYLVKP